MKKNGFIFVYVLATLFIGFLGGVLSLKFFVAETGDVVAFSKSYTVEDSDLVKVVDKVFPFVVSIKGKSDAVMGHNFDFERVSGGTGFIISSDGLILTNKHVVNGDSYIYTVMLNDGREFKATILSKDPFDDIAVLKLVSEEKLDLPVANIGDSDFLSVGQHVFAIGNALGLYQNTVTSGIVSAKGRDVTAFNDSSTSSQSLSGLIQTDAAINMGNSGGPLLNFHGEIIGMNVAVSETANGIGFAIPSNDIKPAIASVIRTGEIDRPVLGVRFLSLNKEQAASFDKELSGGALITNDGTFANPGIEPYGPADTAGVKNNDIIVSVNGELIVTKNPLQKMIWKYSPGDRVVLRVWRDGSFADLDLVLGSSKDL